MKVVIPQDITAAGKDYLLERGYELVIGNGDTDYETLKSLIADADALLARTCKYPAEVLAAGKNLKVIGRHGIGYDNLDIPYCKEHGIPVMVTPQANGLSVAEHAVAMMLALAHSIVKADKAVKNGQWNTRNNLGSYDLKDKTLGVIGFGRIGSTVARKCIAGFDMKVLGYDAYVPAEYFPEGATKVDTIEEILKNADVITLHAPSTPETRDMINKETLAMMKPGAILINCARGDLVNEEDLYEALTNGTIYAAAVDVLHDEPPKMDNPLLQLDNFIVSPHSAALTKESMDRMGLHAAMGIHCVLSGEYEKTGVAGPYAEVK